MHPRCKLYSSKTELGEESFKSSPLSSPVGSDESHEAKRARTSMDKFQTPDKDLTVRPDPLIVLPLKEVYDIVSMYTSAPNGCVNWTQLAAQVTNCRLSPAEVEYVANEFVPQTHYRPSLGMVVMERTSKGNTDFQRHKQTLKRIKQGLPLMVKKFKELFTLAVPSTPPKEDAEEAADTIPNTIRAHPIDSFVANASADLIAELKEKADLAISRFEKGEQPTFAMSRPLDEAEAIAMGLTATGRPKRRYETKAIRLAKEAARSAGVLAESPKPKEPEPNPGFQLPPFFMQLAKHFTERVDG